MRLNARQLARMLFLSLGKLSFLLASIFDISVPGRTLNRKKCHCKTAFSLSYRQILLAESQLLLSTVKHQVWDLEILSQGTDEDRSLGHYDICVLFLVRCWIAPLVGLRKGRLDMPVFPKQK